MGHGPSYLDHGAATCSLKNRLAALLPAVEARTRWSVPSSDKTVSVTPSLRHVAGLSESFHITENEAPAARAETLRV
jgi:hypothetical protein